MQIYQIGSVISSEASPKEWMGLKEKSANCHFRVPHVARVLYSPFFPLFHACV